MTKKAKQFIGFFLLMTVFSSCFQVIEEINLKNDGTGQAQITLNLSQSKAKIASILLMDSINGYKVPSEKDIYRLMNEAVDFLNKKEGITNITKSVDLKNYILSVKFNFNDVTNLNNLTQQLLKEQKIKSVNVSSYTYDKKINIFKRNYQYVSDAKKEYNKLKAEDKAIFKTATFTSIYRFDRTIASSSNPLCKQSPSGKAVMLNTPVMELINGQTNISNIVQLTQLANTK
jgi:hypothetical protein